MRHALLFSLLTLTCIAGCASRRDNPGERQYIGTWYAQGQETSYTWKLAADGSFGQAKGFVTPKTDDGNWRVDRGELILDRKKGGPERINAKVIGNTMTVPGEEGPIIFTKTN